MYPRFFSLLPFLLTCHCLLCCNLRPSSVIQHISSLFGIKILKQHKEQEFAAEQVCSSTRQSKAEAVPHHILVTPVPSAEVTMASPWRPSPLGRGRSLCQVPYAPPLYLALHFLAVCPFLFCLYRKAEV